MFRASESSSSRVHFFYTLQAVSGILYNLLLYSTRSPTWSVPGNRTQILLTNLDPSSTNSTVFTSIHTINSCYFLKLHSLVGLYKADVVNLTWSRKWIIVCYLGNIILKIFPDIGVRMRCSGLSHAHPNISEFVFCSFLSFLFDQ